MAAPMIDTVREKVLPPVHPGEILLEEFMKPLRISQNRLARDLSRFLHGGSTRSFTASEGSR
jgi:hypothetical protein